MVISVPAAAAVCHSLSAIISGDNHHKYADWENPTRFLGFAKRLELVINQLLWWLPVASPESVPAGVATSMKGIAGELEKVVEALKVYQSKSNIVVLMKCREVYVVLQDGAVAIGGWLALLGLALDEAPELQKKIMDLSRDMKQAHFTAAENEERVHQMLQEEGKGRKTSKAVQSAIVMDIARVLGIDFHNHDELLNQVKLLKIDLCDSTVDSDRRVLESLEEIVGNWLIEPDIMAEKVDFDSEDEAQLSPLKNFLCPLTKEVMKDSVVLESGQTYERAAIKHWFEWCIEDGRKPTCPVTGVVLGSLELKPNIGLAGAIEEWITRSVDIQIKSVVQCLTEDSSSDHAIEQVLDRTCKITENHPASRCQIRNAGLVALLIGILQNSSKRFGSLVRSKALMVLVAMTKDDDSKKLMLEEGVSRLAIHSLVGSSDEEREYAVKLLLEFSCDENCCVKIASEKGALVLLSSIADSHENPSLAHLAEDVLKRIERIDDNIKELAAAGRFGPLLKQLHEGSDEVRANMASILGSMILTNSSKEQIARQGVQDLVQLLWRPSGAEASLKALHNLSSWDDNAGILVDSAALPALTNILFQAQTASPEMKELSAAIIANIVANPGHWELASADTAGNVMQSEVIVSNLLGVLPRASQRCQLSVLQILCSTASSPQASESVTAHIKAGEGIKIIVRFLNHPRAEHRICGFRTVRILSESLSEDLAGEIRACHKIQYLKDKVLDNQSTDSERSDSACILANITLSDNEVKTVLGARFLKWIVTTLRDQQQGGNSQQKSCMAEGLLGILLHFLRNHDSETASIIKELHLMSVLCDQLTSTGKPRVKQLAALGLESLSRLERTLAAAAGEPRSHQSRTFCSALFIMCGKTSSASSSCPIHNIPCEESNNQLCLLRSSCIKPLIGVLGDKDINVQVAAVQALSTLLPDTSSTNFKRLIDELDDSGVIDGLISLFTEARPGELQDKAIWMVERVLRSEGLALQQSLNQPLVRALVEALKDGSCPTKKHAQDALTSLKQISGVCGKTSNQNRARR